MKIFSAILAIHIMGFVFVPCSDTHAKDSQHNQVIESLNLHEHHLDSCSPFCFCSCCQTETQPAIYKYFSHFATLTGTSVPYIICRELSFPVIHWRPPKI